MCEVSELIQLVENISFYLTTLYEVCDSFIYEVCDTFISALVGNLNMEESLSFFISSLHFMGIWSFICRYLKYLQVLDHKMIYHLFLNMTYSIWTQQVHSVFSL